MNVNTIKKGEMVRIRLSYVKWEVEHLVENYTMSVAPEFHKTDYLAVHFWLSCLLSKVEPVVKVIGYGAPEDVKNSKRRNLKIRIVHMGKKINQFVAEENVRKLL